MYSYINTTIGIHGLAQVGKDTAAIILRDELELKPYTIAQPVTEECAALLNISHHGFLELNKNTKLLGKVEIQRTNNTALYQDICAQGRQSLLADVINAKTKRELMQAVGHCLRFRNPWRLLENLQHRIHCNEDSSHLFNGSLITDIRLPQEADFVRKRNGIVIHILNDKAKAAPPDITEQHLPVKSLDYALYNNGTKKEFENKVRELCLQLRQQLIGSAA